MKISRTKALTGLLGVVVLTVAEVALVFTPAGASSRTEQAIVVPDANAPTALPVSTPLAHKPPTGKKVVFMDGGLTPSQLLSQGLASASRALGWSYSTMTYSEANPATLITGMQSAISDGANVLVVQATPIAEYQQVLAAAEAKGVLVIDDSSSNSPTPGVTALIGNGNANAKQWAAALAAETVSSANGKTVHVAIVTAPLFATILQGTTNAYQQDVMKLCKKCTVATISIPAVDVITGGDAKDVVSFLQTHPDTNYLMFGSSLLDVGTRAALNAAGNSSVKIIGQDGLSDDVTELQKGQATAWLDEPLEVDGWMALDAAARAMTGGNPTIWYHHLEPTLVLTTKTHFSSNALPEVPVNYQKEFKKLWHVNI